MIEWSRSPWRAGKSVDALVELRDELDAMLEEGVNLVIIQNLLEHADSEARHLVVLESPPTLTDSPPRS
jgi:hypothetical protein